MGPKKREPMKVSTPPPQQVDADNVDDTEIIDPVLGGIQFSINNLKKYINETLPKCPTDQIKRTMADKLENMLLKLVKSEMVYSKSKLIVEDVVDKLPDQPNADVDFILNNCDSIDEISNKRITEYENGLTEDDLKGHSVYIRLMEDMARSLAMECNSELEQGPDVDDVDDTSEEEDDDDEEEEEEEEETDIEVQDEDPIPKTDPVTKKPLTDPVRNKNCGHIYGKSSITQLIKQNRKLRCPIPGCNNKDFLRVSHIINDKNLTADVKKRTQAASKSKKR